jgi:hypothetical protein
LSAVFLGTCTPPPATPESRAQNCTVKFSLRPDSSVVERGPEKAGVGGSIPSLATTFQAPEFARVKWMPQRCVLNTYSKILQLNIDKEVSLPPFPQGFLSSKQAEVWQRSEPPKLQLPPLEVSYSQALLLQLSLRPIPVPICLLINRGAKG